MALSTSGLPTTFLRVRQRAIRELSVRRRAFVRLRLQVTNQADAFSSFSHPTYGCGIEYVRIYDVSMGNSRLCHPLPIQRTSRHQGTRSSCAEHPGCRCWVLLPRGIFPLACCKFGLLNLKVAIHLSIPHKCKHANDLVDLSLVGETMSYVLSIYRAYSSSR